MLLVGVKNISTQSVLADGLIDIGTIYRKYCKKNYCGVPTYNVTSNSISLLHSGIYHLTATFVATGAVAGDVTIQLLVNNEEIDGAFATETITTATTELRTFVIDYYILVDKDCVLGTESTSLATISFANTGVPSTITSVVVNVEKGV